DRAGAEVRIPKRGLLAEISTGRRRMARPRAMGAAGRRLSPTIIDRFSLNFPPARFRFAMEMWKYGIIALFALILTGCTLAPKEAADENERARRLGQSYERPFEQRQIPDLGADPTWQELLQRAFLANGDLEASYFDWRAALARIPQASAYPNSNLAPSF